MTRRRLYAIHCTGRAIPGATMAGYLRDYYFDNGMAPRAALWFFYRQDAAGNSYVAAYPARAKHAELLKALAREYPIEEDELTDTVKVELWRRRPA